MNGKPKLFRSAITRVLTVILCAAALLAGAEAGWAAQIPVVVGTQATTAERQVARELADGLNKTYPGDRFSPTATLPETGDAIVIGTRASQPVIAKVADDATANLSPEGFAVTVVEDSGRKLAIIAGADPRGVVYGVYAVLEKLGWGFYLSYDAAPPPKSEPFSFDGWKLADKPVVPNRVVFNWHNFLSGCSTWSLEHWKKWILQSQKMGYNAVMVHAYGNNPMVQFSLNGETKPVGYLSTTRSGRDWSTMHVNDVRRMWGGEVFDSAVFGSAAAMVSDSQRVAAVRQLMRDAFEYAGARSMGVYFAFDIETVQANPQNVIMTLPESARFQVPAYSVPGQVWLADTDTPEGYAYYKAQVTALVESYPNITTLVCWFRWGGKTPWMWMRRESMPAAWQKEYDAELAKTPEVARMEKAVGCFALGKVVRAYTRALQEVGRSDIKIATGTWAFSFYSPCDRFMPRDVMFIGLDYGALKGGQTCFDDPRQRREQAIVGARREILPVAWAHHDDGNYTGRPYTPYENYADKLADMKASGFGIIHWMTRPLDLYFKSLADQVKSSKKNQPLVETCAEMAARTFGEAAREKGGQYLKQWVTEAPIFARETTDHFVDRVLEDPKVVAAGCRERLAILSGIDEAALMPLGRDYLNYYRGLERYIRDVHENENAFRRADERLRAGDLEAARVAMRECNPEETIRRFAKFASLGGVTRGEQGLVVSLNTRWLSHYQRLRQGLGMEVVRTKFGPTQHDPLAQSVGRYTFYFGKDRSFWQVWGTKETGVAVFVLSELAKVGLVEGMRAEDEEICRDGIQIATPFKLNLGPILATRSRGNPAAMELPAGTWQIELLALNPGPEACAMDVSIAPAARDRQKSGMNWYAFAPVKARWLRVACNGTDKGDWNSIWEVKLDALDKSGKIMASGAMGAENAAALAADGNPETRWAIEGKRQWIQFPLDPAKETGRIGIAWFQGESRRANFRLLVSDDGRKWQRVAIQPVASEKEAASPSSASAIVGRIEIAKADGGTCPAARMVRELTLKRPATLELTLTPVKGNAVLCGAVLTRIGESK